MRYSLIRYTPLPTWLAWVTFGQENRAPTFDEMLRRIGHYWRPVVDVFTNSVGCTVLVQPSFLAATD